MRLALALVVACVVASCGFGPSGPLGFGGGDAARSAQASLDAEAILQGMAQVRGSDEFVARDINHPAPGSNAPQVTR